MSRVYDLWEKLVGAVLDREKFRQLALRSSSSSSCSSFSDYSPRFSFVFEVQGLTESLEEQTVLRARVRLLAPSYRRVSNKRRLDRGRVSQGTYGFGDRGLCNGSDPPGCGCIRGALDDPLCGAAQQMEWKHMNSRIRKWHVAMRRIIGVYLSSAKRLFDQVLFCLLNFGHAVLIGPHNPEWLFCLLDMYEVLADLMPDLDALFPQEAESLIRIEFHELVLELGESGFTVKIMD
ncbi:hypothetical protein SASPL_152412 [Salvia splendens]|uniref:Exocyst subunit Exo70 family protein n=1 Tax=Salvia splendens TaxID=180675 RepID=A0A8X8W2Y6_SALSN|nr:hypothetical protein SASPL_152412 [Salvia splendens]